MIDAFCMTKNDGMDQDSTFLPQGARVLFMGMSENMPQIIYV